MMTLHSPKWWIEDGTSGTSTSSLRASGKSTVPRKTCRKFSGRTRKAIRSFSHKRYLLRVNGCFLVTLEVSFRGPSCPGVAVTGRLMQALHQKSFVNSEVAKSRIACDVALNSLSLRPIESQDKRTHHGWSCCHGGVVRGV